MVNHVPGMMIEEEETSLLLHKRFISEDNDKETEEAGATMQINKPSRLPLLVAPACITSHTMKRKIVKKFKRISERMMNIKSTDTSEYEKSSLCMALSWENTPPYLKRNDNEFVLDNNNNDNVNIWNNENKTQEDLFDYHSNSNNSHNTIFNWFRKLKKTENLTTREQVKHPLLSSPRHCNGISSYFTKQCLKSVAVVLLVSTLVNPVAAFCPRGCECDDVGLRVQCINADLDTIPILLNPGTKDLDLGHNRIKTILQGFIFYNKLQYLDLSHNEIVSLGIQNFASQSSLGILEINNNKISKIQSRAFIGLTNLSNLDLSDNYIEVIEKNAFSSLNHLKMLDLSNNRIKNITSETFKKMHGLKVLNLCKNELREISSTIFEPLKELQDLDLCSNQIKVIQDSAFSSLTNLAQLSLHSNKVYSFHENALSDLNSLKVLDLRGNALKEIPSIVLESITDLEELDISHNPLTSLQNGPFTQLSNLMILHISHCENLTNIDSGAFTSLSKLNSLDLSFNPQLMSLDDNLFKPLINLRHLILRGNGLKSFDQFLVNTKYLQSLDLRDNRLECNCSIKWLQEASLNKSLALKIEEVFCASPESLRGRSLSGLTEYELECYSNLVVIASCVAAAVFLILLLSFFGFLYYKNCRKMKSMVHDNWPEKIVATWKDPEYEKQVEDDEYTFHSLRGVQHIPVTVI
ncbi:unnamed protein product [Meganyctiphanes norvegica]|uniref:LRRCT domain-containing protein n=1 Tax=Meganyctiphanes norvegica TaxID=48144 RepID=A0AAV2RIB0_MEGNR